MQWKWFALTGAMMMLASAGHGQSDLSGASGFPGDIGRPFRGLPLPDGPRPPPNMPGAAPGPAMEKALTLAKAAVAACKGFHVGVSIIDSEGAPKLYYVPDGTGGYHAYIAFRKAYTALRFKQPSSVVGANTKNDPALAAKIVADTNFMSFAGGLPIFEHGEVVGAIGVSGAEPSAEDERCALFALNAKDGGSAPSR
jgi:glc operon protein GlcG